MVGLLRGGFEALPAFGRLFGEDISTYQVTLACRIVHRIVAMKAA
ncbi:hypothetical protein [Hoeflea poritis]|nr:hypothetical protein [Hoeflea poritis]